MKLSELYKILKPYASIVRLLMLYMIALSVISIITPFLNSAMIDEGLLRQDVPAVILFVLALIFLQILDHIIQYFQTRQEIKLSNTLGKDLKRKALSHGLRLHPEYFKEQGFYKTIGDAMYDIDNIMSIVSSNFLVLFVLVCKSVGAAFGLFLLDWQLALFIASLIPVKIAFNTWMRAKAERLGKEQMLANKNYNTWFSDLLSGVTDIKLWNLYPRKIAEYEEHVDKMNEASKNLSLLNAAHTRLLKIIELLFMNSMYILGALLIRGDRLTLGNLFTFITFSGYLLIPVDILMDLRIMLKQIQPSVEGIKDFFGLEEENYSSTLLPEPQISGIQFKNVSVSFDKRIILHDISFEINRGTKVAIVGDNGSGKTTLLNLLLGLCRPTQGAVLVDGIPISEYHIEEYRKKFSVVTQNIHLFRGTVKENITLDSSASLLRTPRLEFCHDAVNKLEKQYDTPVGSEGAKLSGGERQKVGLLRALHRKSEILVLDEATSNFDRESEECFNLFIKENRDYAFYFIVTHRKEILNYVDKVLYLSHGEITRIESPSQS